MRTKILLADDHKIMRDGLRALLEKELDMEVVAEACEGRETVQKVKEFKPHIIIMDITMPNLNGIEATRQIINDVPRAKIIALSMHSESSFVMKMLESGASAYLLKESAFKELSTAITTVLSGKIYLSPAIAVVVGDATRLPQKASRTTAKLTPREREVLQLLAEGNSTKQVATQLSMAIKTVETHRSQIMKKLDIHSIAELTKWAVREGITSLE
jgi:DNA-binding NarL/FixJ family response regulator